MMQVATPSFRAVARMAKSLLGSHSISAGVSAARS